MVSFSPSVPGPRPWNRSEDRTRISASIRSPEKCASVTSDPFWPRAACPLAIPKSIAIPIAVMASGAARLFAITALPSFLVFDHGLRRREPRNRHAEGRGAHVVHSRAVAKLYALSVAAVLAANSDLQLRTRLAPALDRPLDQHAHAVHVECLERIVLEDRGLGLVNINGQKSACVVAGKAHGGLGEIVCAKREELGHFSDLVGEKRGTGNLDHRAYKVFKFYFGF